MPGRAGAATAACRAVRCVLERARRHVARPAHPSHRAAAPPHLGDRPLSPQPYVSRCHLLAAMSITPQALPSVTSLRMAPRRAARAGGRGIGHRIAKVACNLQSSWLTGLAAARHGGGNRRATAAGPALAWPARGCVQRVSTAAARASYQRVATRPR